MYKTSSRTNLKYEDVVQHDDITVRESRISPILIVIESKKRFLKISLKYQNYEPCHSKSLLVILCV